MSDSNDDQTPAWLRPKGFGREDLFGSRCGDPTCTAAHATVYFGPICHPGKPVRAFWDNRYATVVLECAACGRFVAAFAVAARDQRHVPRREDFTDADAAELATPPVVRPRGPLGEA